MVLDRDAWEGAELTKKSQFRPPSLLPDPDGPDPGLFKFEIGPKGRGGKASVGCQLVAGAAQANREGGGERVKNPMFPPPSPPLAAS